MQENLFMRYLSALILVLTLGGCGDDKDVTTADVDQKIAALQAQLDALP